jgi:hypothetical protein
MNTMRNPRRAAGEVDEADGNVQQHEQPDSPVHHLTIVIKLGSSSIVNEDDFQPQLALLSSIAETVSSLRRKGHRVVLVSSGAIAMGLKRMDLRLKPKVLAEKQVSLSLSLSGESSMAYVTSARPSLLSDKED